MSERLRAYLKESGMTQAQLAREIGISPSAVSRIFSGKLIPSVGVFMKMQDIFGFSCDYIVGRTDEK